VNLARSVLQLLPMHAGALYMLGQAARVRGRNEAAAYYFAKAKAAMVQAKNSATVQPALEP
jgi:hypothetical protein